MLGAQSLRRAVETGRTKKYTRVADREFWQTKVTWLQPGEIFQIWHFIYFNLPFSSGRIDYAKSVQSNHTILVFHLDETDPDYIERHRLLARLEANRNRKNK